MENNNDTCLTKNSEQQIPALRLALQTLEKEIDYNLQLSSKHKVLSVRLDGDTPSNVDEKEEKIEPKSIVTQVYFIAQKIKYSNRVLEHSLREFEHSLGQA